MLCFLFFFKQKTAYEMRISDWSSDVCSSDLEIHRHPYITFDIEGTGLDEHATAALALGPAVPAAAEGFPAKPITLVVPFPPGGQIGRASCRERVCQYV